MSWSLVRIQHSPPINKDTTMFDEIQAVPFPSYEAVENSRNDSSKSVNATTYDRYEKYHHPAGTVFALSTVIETVISFVKKVIKYGN